MNGSKALAGTSSDVTVGGKGASGVWYSNDNGETWEQSISDISQNLILCLSMNNSYALAGCIGGAGSEVGGVWYSTDSGETWEQSISDISANTITCVFINGSNALAGTNQFVGAWYSNNSGVTWSQSVSDISNQKINALFMNGSNALAGSRDAGVWYSIDMGVTWSQSVSDISNQYIKSLSMNGSNAIAGTLDTGVWYSNDIGVTWSQSSGSINNKNITSVFINGSDAIAGSENGAWYSTLNYVCFKHDALILTENGYIKIQELRPGHLVKTVSNGYKPIHSIGKRNIRHPACAERIKDQLYLCTKENYPELFEDLVITGCHSILVPNFKDDGQKQKTLEVNGDIYVTEGHYRVPSCVDDRSLVYSEAGEYTIYHFALENNDYYMNYGVYANGLLVETCSKRYLNELSGMELLE